MVCPVMLTRSNACQNTKASKETALAQALGTINKGCTADKAILEKEVTSVEKMQGMMGKLKVAGADAATTAKPEVTPAKA